MAKWRVLVNLYFRNLRVMKICLVDSEKIKEVVDKVIDENQVERCEELRVKMEEIERMVLDPMNPLFAIKRPFDDS